MFGWAAAEIAAGALIVERFCRTVTAPILSPQVVETGVASELEGSVSIDFAPEGLRCRIVASVDPGRSRENGPASRNSTPMAQAEAPLSGRQAAAPK